MYENLDRKKLDGRQFYAELLDPQWSSSQRWIHDNYQYEDDWELKCMHLTKGNVKSTLIVNEDVDEITEEVKMEDQGRGHIIKQQIEDPTHPMSHIISSFSEVFVRNYGKYVDKNALSEDEIYEQLEDINEMMSPSKVRWLDSGRDSEQIGTSQTERSLYTSKYMLTDQIVQDLKVFIGLSLELLTDFYSLSPMFNRHSLISMREEMIDITSTRIIRDDVYKVVITFYQIETQDLGHDLVEKYKQFLHVKPENLNIDEYLCLNSSSPLLEVAREQKSMERLPGRRGTVNMSLAHSIPHDELEFPPPLPCEDDIKDRFIIRPYQTAIDELRKLDAVQSPMEKMWLMARVHEQIMDSVDDFWAGVNVDKDNLIISAEHNVKIYLYLVIRCKISNFFAQVRFM